MEDSVVKFRLVFKANFNSSPGRIISSSALGYIYMQLEVSNNYCIFIHVNIVFFLQKTREADGHWLYIFSFLLPENCKSLVTFKTRLLNFSEVKNI